MSIVTFTEAIEINISFTKAPPGWRGPIFFPSGGGFHNFLKIPVCGTPFSSHHGLLPPGLGLPTKNSCTSPNAGLGLPLSCRLLSLHTFFPLESSRLWPGQHPSTFLSFPIIFSTILLTVNVLPLLPFPGSPLAPNDYMMLSGFLLPAERWG